MDGRGDAITDHERTVKEASQCLEKKIHERETESILGRSKGIAQLLRDADDVVFANRCNLG